MMGRAQTLHHALTRTDVTLHASIRSNPGLVLTTLYISYQYDIGMFLANSPTLHSAHPAHASSRVAHCLVHTRHLDSVPSAATSEQSTTATSLR